MCSAPCGHNGVHFDEAFIVAPKYRLVQCVNDSLSSEPVEITARAKRPQKPAVVADGRRPLHSMCDNKNNNSMRIHWAANPRFVEFYANLVKCDVVARIQMLVEVVCAENRSPLKAVIFTEILAACGSGEVGIFAFPSMLPAPTPGVNRVIALWFRAYFAPAAAA